MNKAGFQVLKASLLIVFLCISIVALAEIKVTSSGWRSPTVEKFPPENKPDDLKDGDGRVNLCDFALIAGDWLSTSLWPMGD